MERKKTQYIQGLVLAEVSGLRWESWNTPLWISYCKCTLIILCFQSRKLRQRKGHPVARGGPGVGSLAEELDPLLAVEGVTRGKIDTIGHRSLASRVCQTPSPELASEDITLSPCQSIPIILKAAINQQESISIGWKSLHLQQALVGKSGKKYERQINRKVLNLTNNQRNAN